MKSAFLTMAFLAALLFASTPASALTYSLTVSADSQAYAGSATIHLGGQVSPAPGPGTAVLIRILNPNKVVVTADEAQVNGTTGAYSDAIVAGGSTNWVGGQYLVNVTWGAYPPVVFVTTTFTWSSTATTSTTSSTSSASTLSSSSSTTSSSTSTSTSSASSSTSQQPTTSSSQSTSSSTSSQAATTSTSTSGGGGGIPEFPYQGAAVALATVLVVASYVVMRRRSRPLGPRSPGGAPVSA